MATFSLSTLSLSSSRFFSLGAPTRFHGYPNRLVFPPLKCSSSSSDSDTAMPPDGWAYKLTAGLAGIGFLETSYLTYLKLTESEAFCPVGGAACSDILNSDYAIVFGVPLPMIGMAAYAWI